MKFLIRIVASLASRGFYGDVLNGREKIGFKYLFELQIFSSLFIILIISLNLSGLLPSLETKANDLLPPGAEIIIKDGKLRTNTNPIIITMPEGVVGEAKYHKNLLVIDVSTQLSVSDMDRKDTMILVNRDGIISRTTGRVQVDSFKEIPGLSLTLDREWFIEKAAWMKSNAKFVPFLLFVPLLLFFYITSLFWALIYGLITYFILYLYKIRKPFKVAFSVGLYSRTFGALIALIMIMAPTLNMVLLAIPLNILFIFFMIRPGHKKGL